MCVYYVNHAVIRAGYVAQSINIYIMSDVTMLARLTSGLTQHTHMGVGIFLFTWDPYTPCETAVILVVIDASRSASSLHNTPPKCTSWAQALAYVLPQLICDRWIMLCKGQKILLIFLRNTAVARLSHLQFPCFLTKNLIRFLTDFDKS